MGRLLTLASVTLPARININRVAHIVFLTLRRAPVKVISVYRDEHEVNAARPGENLRLRVQGIEEDDISAGERRSASSQRLNFR